MTTTTKSTTELHASSVSTQQPTSQGFRQTMRNALIITRREVRDSFRDWRIVAPIIVLTFFFPFLAQDVASRFAVFLEGYGAEIIGERTIPFLLMIVGFFPISISLVIALETFVGEKERKSLEPLLSTPMTNTELYIGKTLSAMIPPLMASFGGMVVYLSTLLGGQLAWRPPAMLIVQIFLLTIVQALVMVTGAVVVSSQTTSTRASNLLASFIIIPMTLIINGESIIMFLAPDANSPSGISALWSILVGMFVVVILLLRVGNSIFNREELLGRTIDSINLRNTFRKVWRWARSKNDKGVMARGISEWYRQSVPYSLRKLNAPMMISGVVFIVAFGAGLIVGLQPEWQLPLEDQSTFNQTQDFFENFVNVSSEVRLQAIGFVIWQNARVLLAATILAMFTFGAASLIISPIVYAILGYLFSQFMVAGFDLTLFWGAILPHGIVEIPIILIATATAFHLGSTITKPPAGSTVGHAWSVALGDTIKIWVGVIIPGLILAALLEVLLTPQVVGAIVGS